MSYVAILLSVAALWLFAVVSPGPNFLITARLAVAHSCRTALEAVGGIAVGTVAWAAAGCFGVQALFAVAPWMHTTIKVAGAIYLMVMGSQLMLRSWSQASDSQLEAVGGGLKLSPFQLGLLTTLANPRSAVSVASIFATTVPPSPSLALSLAVMILMTSMSVSWYAAIACLFATRHLAQGYRQFRRWIDRVAGACLMLFGAKLAIER